MHVTNTVFFYKSGRTFYSWAISKGSFREAQRHLQRWDGGDNSVLLNHKDLLILPIISPPCMNFFSFFLKQNEGKPLLSTAHQFCHPFSWGHERTHSGTSQDEASEGCGGQRWGVHQVPVVAVTCRELQQTGTSLWWESFPMSAEAGAGMWR